MMILQFLVLLSGCTSLIQVDVEPMGAEVYVTDYPPNPAMKPKVYETGGVAPFVGEVDYFAWTNNYVWVDAPGYQAQVVAIPHALKVGPAVGGFCLWPLWAWAWGPQEAPLYVDLRPGVGPEDR